MRDHATSSADLFASAARRAPLVVVGIETDGERQISILGEGAPAAAEDLLFEIGSVTKTFTALLLADMVQRKEVALSDPVSRYVGEESSPLSRVTLADLATHTARLPRLPRDLWWRALRNPRNPYYGYDVPHLRAALDRVRGRHRARKRVRYSNFGYATLGLALSRAGGIAYEDLVTSRICGPLGLSSTSPSPEGGLQQKLAQGYNKRGRPTAPWDFESFAAAGVLKSCVKDLLTYLDAHVDPSTSALETALQQIQAPRVYLRGGRVAIGLAWFVQEGDGARSIWHNGETGGFSAFAGFNPAARTSVVALANSQVADRLTQAGTRTLALAGKRSLDP